MQSPSDNERLGGLTQGYSNDDHTNPPLSVRSTKYRMQSPSDNERLGGLTQGYSNDDHTNPSLSVRSTVCRAPPIMIGLAG
ncbi:hypothetical protein J6590_067998 [Homalodisca vitripennis]|nr:hypothetical protein J6590_067998 [Homalodisca vitripennis]